MTDVLILEDELTSLQALSEILTTYSDDIRVHKASSLKEAKDLLDQEIRYGLFLLDVNLSGEDRDLSGLHLSFRCHRFYIRRYQVSVRQRRRWD